MKTLTLTTVLLCMAGFAMAQQLQVDPNSILLELKKGNPQTKKFLQQYDQFHKSLLNVEGKLDVGQYITSNEKGKVYKMSDGMLYLQPKTDVAIDNQMPGTSSQPKAFVAPVNPIPNPLSPKPVSPSVAQR